MVSRRLFETVGPFDAGLERFEDWDWLMRLAPVEPLGFLAEPLSRIVPSGFSDLEKAVRALAALRAKYVDRLLPRQRRAFLSGLDVERAATRYRRGERLAAIGGVLRSLARAPLGNVAVAAVVGNALSR
jgi:hypothetical protein